MNGWQILLVVWSAVVLIYMIRWATEGGTR